MSYNKQPDDASHVFVRLHATKKLLLPIFFLYVDIPSHIEHFYEKFRPIGETDDTCDLKSIVDILFLNKKIKS